jgi:phospholipase C
MAKREHSRAWRRALRTLAATTILAGAAPAFAADDGDRATTTPIKHLVVIFQENVSFDHYFATYPKATNVAGEPRFAAREDTPSVNGLNGALLSDNPNGANPIRLDRSQAVTCDNDHDYTDEQRAVDGGLLDKFIGPDGLSCGGTIGLDYFDGNTVTAMWNYAQHFAMNDNSFGTTFGPSTPGALNLVSGQMHAVGMLKTLDDAAGDLAGDVTLSVSTITGDADPLFDDCGAPDQAGFAPKGGADNHNIGDLLNAKGITWGWFQGGFAPTQPAIFNPDGSVKSPAVCGLKTTGHPGVNPGNPADPVHAPTTAYSAHHNPFEYYLHSANIHHLPPTSAKMVGKTDQAMHQYDLACSSTRSRTAACRQCRS